MTGEVRTPEEWMWVTGILIMDPDGWRREGDPPWSQPITREEFIRRAGVSTVRGWPSPLFDEGVSEGKTP